MNRTFAFLLLLLLVFISSFSQVFLKKSAETTYSKKWQEYLNPYVIGSYSILLLVTLVVSMLLRYIPISYVSISEVFGYIFVAIFSKLFFQQKTTKNQKYGFIIIIIGALIFTIY